MKEGKKGLAVLVIPSLHLEQENSKYDSFMYGPGYFHFWRHPEKESHMREVRKIKDVLILTV